MSIQSQSDRYDRDALLAMNGRPVVLNLGCGTDDRGIGIDINYEPDIKHDLDDGIPVADDAVDEILCRHVLEHVNNPAQLLDEARRVLADHGDLKLEVPNVGWLPVRLWLSQDPHRFWSHKNPERKGHWLARKLGNDDENRTAHRSLWTPALLAEHLDRAGFDYDISGSHISRNFSATATPETPSTGQGQTLHELERDGSEEMASGDYWAQTRARIMVDWIQRGDPARIVDIGCGSGYLTARIAETGDHEVIGIDKNAESITAAQRRESRAAFRVGDAFDLDFVSNSVDCVIFGDVLEHLDEPARAVEAATRVLTEDGFMIISVPAFRWLYGPHDEHNGHVDRFTADRLADLVGEAGCELRRHRYTNLLPMAPYLLYQRVLNRPIPTGVRGQHGGLLEWVKQRAIDAEVTVDPPIGITLIAEVEPV